MYKWKPSKTQRKEFATNMQNPEFASEHTARKQARCDKRRSTSAFDYATAGGYYIPAKIAYDFCIANYANSLTLQNQIAFNAVIHGFINNEKVHHDSIHIVNELIKKTTYEKQQNN